MGRVTVKNLRALIDHVNVELATFRKDLRFTLESGYGRWYIGLSTAGEGGSWRISDSLPTGQIYETLHAILNTLWAIHRPRTPHRLTVFPHATFDLAEAKRLRDAGCICHYAGAHFCGGRTGMGHLSEHATRMRELLCDQ